MYFRVFLCRDIVRYGIYVIKWQADLLRIAAQIVLATNNTTFSILAVGYRRFDISVISYMACACFSFLLYNAAVRFQVSFRNFSSRYYLSNYLSDL